MSDTTTAVYWVRRSQGDNDGPSLKDQREYLPEMAQQLADDVEAIDLGTHTGFSLHSRDEDKQRLDAHPDVQQLENDLRDGRYDYLIAWDDTRLCRDEYYQTLQHLAIRGDCQIKFYADVSDDDLAFGVKRTVEREVKKEEIQKSRRATQRRVENGCYQGRPPFGLAYDRDGCHLERDEEEWATCEEIWAADEHTKVDVPKATASRVKQRGREWYQDRLEEYGRMEAQKS